MTGALLSSRQAKERLAVAAGLKRDKRAGTIHSACLPVLHSHETDKDPDNSTSKAPFRCLYPSSSLHFHRRGIS
ncbi:hypothetical protein CSUI_010519 [Cystoisospora suis]|uniref:Uncharacterized protein n=1 Tax=Cystoisospora suis TaxID=483139 RepID=A0A2C6KG62_9APIC|nr:hypothetical protein CSUI_010519 [Cystoisospora suis]